MRGAERKEFLTTDCTDSTDRGGDEWKVEVKVKKGNGVF
jgi:hypothetical protein